MDITQSFWRRVKFCESPDSRPGNNHVQSDVYLDCKHTLHVLCTKVYHGSCVPKARALLVKNGAVFYRKNILGRKYSVKSAVVVSVKATIRERDGCIARKIAKEPGALFREVSRTLAKRESGAILFAEIRTKRSLFRSGAPDNGKSDKNIVFASYSFWTYLLNSTGCFVSFNYLSSDREKRQEREFPRDVYQTLISPWVGDSIDQRWLEAAKCWILGWICVKMNTLRLSLNRLIVAKGYK